MKSLIIAIRRVVSSLMYIGYIPVVGRVLTSLVVVVLLWLTRFTVNGWFTLEAFPLFVWGTVLCILLGSWLCNDAKNVYGVSAPRQIVVDVAVGQLFSFVLISSVWSINASILALGFVGYQFFSVVKPWPLFHFEEVTGGFGYVIDDIAAGVMTALFMHALVALNSVVMPLIS